MRKELRFDGERCMGCCACEIACKMEYQLPGGIRFLIMRQTEKTGRTGQKLHFHFDRCRHCQDPACIKVCQTKAIFKREDGIVLVREDHCTGCRLCYYACPFQAPRFGESESGKVVMQKCSLCAARLDQGLEPSCLLACPAGAIRLVTS